VNAPEVDLLVLGDSLSAGGWERDPAGLGSAWPASLARLANGSKMDLRVKVSARGGSRSTDVLREFRAMEGGSLDVVAVLVGANDVWRRWVPWSGQDPVDEDDFRRNLCSIVRLARDRGARRTWILTPTLLDADPDHPWNEILREYRGICRDTAAREGAEPLPVGEEFEEAVRAHPEVKWSYDGVHPRPVGHERIAWTVLHHGLGGVELPTDSVPTRPSSHRLGSWP
jgi:lysophospholipase L1-like esterase